MSGENGSHIAGERKYCSRCDMRLGLAESQETHDLYCPEVLRVSRETREMKQAELSGDAGNTNGEGAFHPDRIWL